MALTSILQLLYNIVDTIVVGQFAGKEALAAVGATGSLINLLITLFIGLSVGASITLARHYGEGDYQAVRQTAHTAITLSALCGVFIAVVGFVLTKPLLIALAVPKDILDLSVLYMRLYFIGIPFSFVNVFGSAILRAVGDTKRPMYILILSGILNVIFNLIFVILFHMSVAGVALGTVISSVVSAFLVLRVLTRTEGAIRVDIRRLKIKRRVLNSILRIGLPAGLEGATFGISNVLIQSAVNSFGSLVVAGNSISISVMGLIYVLIQSVNQACMTFTSQNMGARQYARVRRSPLITTGIVAVTSFAMCMLFLWLDAPIAGLFNGDPQVIYYANLRMGITYPLYFTFGIMQTFGSQLRGMGHSFLPMVVSVTGISGIRLGWLYTVFAANPTLETLYRGYPVSWIATMIILIVCYIIVIRKVPQGDACEGPQTQGA